MTQEDKDLLLRDLSARLPYGVKGKTLGSKTCTLSFIGNDGSITADTYHCWLSSKQFVPYLRSMSSMTEGEKDELQEIAVALSYNKDDIIIGAQINSFRQLNGVLDLFNSHHLDWRGLIERGLALVAPEGMYNYSKNYN